MVCCFVAKKLGCNKGFLQLRDCGGGVSTWAKEAQKMKPGIKGILWAGVVHATLAAVSHLVVVTVNFLD